MIYQELILGDNFKLTVELRDDRKFKLHKIETITSDQYRLLYINDEQAVEGQILSFDKSYKIKIVDFLNRTEHNSTGVLSSFSKQRSLSVTKQKFYDMEIDTSHRLDIPVDLTNNIATGFFNQVPLFYKFFIEDKDIDFENDTFEIFDLDGVIIPNYGVSSFDNHHSIYLDVTSNNKYFYKINDITTEAIIYPATTSRSYSKELSGDYLEFERSVYMDCLSLFALDTLPDDLTIRITMDDGSSRDLSIEQTSDRNNWKTDSYVNIKDFVKRIDIYSSDIPKVDFYNINKSIIWFNEVQVIEFNNNTYYIKEKETDIIFIAKPFEDLDALDIDADLSDISPLKKYVYINNQLIEHNEGNVTAINMNKIDMILLNYIDYPDETPYTKYLEITSESLDENMRSYYERNFKSVDSIFVTP